MRGWVLSPFTPIIHYSDDWCFLLINAHSLYSTYHELTKHPPPTTNHWGFSVAQCHGSVPTEDVRSSGPFAASAGRGLKSAAGSCAAAEGKNNQLFNADNTRTVYRKIMEYHGIWWNNIDCYWWNIMEYLMEIDGIRVNSYWLLLIWWNIMEYDGIIMN